ncbi:DUF4145 domain-containing protein [[Curtobacterium] plantarum]|uniref:DUF4145 domain-containing protein n=1 Tax=[Curtobacterium] plantarum TaxID=221276 RepID=UPI000F096091|nr:DUF4145 domain-containing protein [[Curtobacterium] plantarum]RNA78762.1 DUF4145 domain-containing protein [[Curtobacterium] plantarum]
MPAYLVSNCPRCDAKKITFKIFGGTPYKVHLDSALDASAEILAMCGSCYGASLFEVVPKSSSVTAPALVDWRNANYNIESQYHLIGFVTPADLAISRPPEALPSNIEVAFIEGSKCLSINCYNAAATMFRLCLDFATKNLLPEEGEPSSKIRRSLGLRMEWLFDNGTIPSSLKDLAKCVKDDGNDGAHEGILDKESALDLEDFTRVLLTRLYTEPAQVEGAIRRRAERHSNK